MASGHVTIALGRAGSARPMRARKRAASPVTCSAAAVGYSQPAVSQHLRRLEGRLEVALLERVGRGVRLTEAGRVLARHAPAVALAVDAALEELAQLRGLTSP